MALYVHGLRLNYHLGQLTRRCQDLDRRDGHLLDWLLVCCPGSGKEVMHQLWQRGLHLITGIRHDMKNHLIPLLDKLLLRKRFIIETLFHKLKSHMGLEHT